MDARTLCLGALYGGSASGYEIRKLFEEGSFSHFYEAGYGSIYPALRRLSEEGLIVGEAQAQDNRPDKKVYTLTPKGRQALFEALLEPPDRDKVRSDLMFILNFGQMLPRRHLERLIDERIAFYRNHLKRMDECDRAACTPGESFVLGFGKAIYRAALDYLENQRHGLIGAARPDAMVAE